MHAHAYMHTACMCLRAEARVALACGCARLSHRRASATLLGRMVRRRHRAPQPLSAAKHVAPFHPTPPHPCKLVRRPPACCAGRPPPACCMLRAAVALCLLTSAPAGRQADSAGRQAGRQRSVRVWYKPSCICHVCPSCVYPLFLAHHAHATQASTHACFPKDHATAAGKRLTHSPCTPASSCSAALAGPRPARACAHMLRLVQTIGAAC